MPKKIIKVKAKINTQLRQEEPYGEKTIEDHIESLVKLSNEKGYLIFDDIVDYSIDNEMSYGDVDSLSSGLKLRGILVYENEPNSSIDDNEEISDFSKIDYSSVYSQIIKMDPQLEPLVEEVKRIKPAQHKEIAQLQYQLYEGNSFARERLIEIHLRRALGIALQRAQRHNADLADVIGASIEGLLKGIDKYNPYENGQLGSYISFWCLQSIGRAMPTNRPLVYYPVHIKEDIFSAADLLKECGLLENYQLIDEKEAYNYLVRNSYPSEKAQLIIESLVPLESICDLNNEIVDYGATNELDNLENGLDWPLLLSHVEQVLTPREYSIIVDRYGLLDDRAKTLEEVGDANCITRERVRQIEKKALRKLKQHNLRW